MIINICICNYNAGNKLKDTLDSISKAKKNHNINVVVFDNASKDNSKDIIIDHKIINHSYISPKNVGKARAINYIVSKILTNISDDDLIFSLDSDIYLIEEDFFDKTIKYWKLLKNHVSCLICWQEGVSLYRRQLKFQKYNKLEYFVPSEGYGYGIAGGAMLIPYKNWKAVNGYRENCGLFGGDDGNLTLDLFRTIKKPICVVKNLRVFHPGDNNIEYRKWKDEALIQQIKNGKCLKNKGFFEN